MQRDSKSKATIRHYLRLPPSAAGGVGTAWTTHGMLLQVYLKQTLAFETTVDQGMRTSEETAT
jgi:hypothetical protein